MHYYEVAPTKIVRNTSDTFTYAYTHAIQPGTLVSIHVGKRMLSGVVMRGVSKPTYETKEISGVLHDTPLPASLLHLAGWLSEYYGTHLAHTLAAILPRGLDKTRRKRVHAPPATPVRDRTHFLFTPDQVHALAKLDAMQAGSAILHGVTGSGKTAVYIEQVKRTLASGKSATILVPEIALTSQLVDEFNAHFSDIILTHSRQTEAQRHLAWLDALESTKPRVVIGPRSALFMPLAQVGLVVLDEAHEPSYKQEQAPRYSALRAASVLTTKAGAKLILGSATPSVSDYYIAKKTKRPIIRMHTPAKQAATPSIELVDMTHKNARTKHRFLSPQLLRALKTTLAAGKQALIFHNRRGSASVTLCDNCGWQAACPNCYLPLTLHVDMHALKCHICNHSERVPTNCPECMHADIVHKGIGTKIIETELTKLYPNKKIVRFDADQDVNTSVDKIYRELYDGHVDIIIGTQVIAKGLDLPKLGLVGVVQADAGLHMPDFSATERTFQLLAQVVGRVGRYEHASHVVVQSFTPAHYAIAHGLAQNYEAFYVEELVARKRGHYPPYTHMAKLVVAYKTEQGAVRAARRLAREIRTQFGSKLKIVGPAPAFYERVRNTYRWQIVLKSSTRETLVQATALAPKTHWQIELDPFNLL